MKLWRGLAPRILALAALSTLLGALLLLPVTARLSLTVGTERVGRLLQSMLSGPEGQRCQADPEGWARALVPGNMARAFDLAHLPSQDGPDPRLLEDLRQGKPVAARLMGRRGGALLVKVAESGGCSLLELRWLSPPSGHRPLAAWLLVITCLGVALAAGLGILMVVRPLVKRIARLHHAARRLGEEGASLEPADPVPDELGELSSAMLAAHLRIRADAQALISKQQALERHLADVAHDLRTPLTALQLSLEHAWQSPDRAEREASLTRCLEDVMYLGSLTENLRLACALQEGLDPQAGAPRADAAQVLETVGKRLELLAQRKGLELGYARPDGVLTVGCSPLMLERAVANLLHNAIQYGQPGGHVAALLEAPMPGRFRLVVLDDGPGVPPAELPRLGERTFRTDAARSREPRGTGLGLAIVGSICHGCGWRLAFEANQPRGLKVIVEGALELPGPTGEPSPP